jgi:hypothetical protein
MDDTAEQMMISQMLCIARFRLAIAGSTPATFTHLSANLMF